jgi:hypothetical protein
MATTPSAFFPYTDRNIWERLPGESAAAYNAWRAYLEMQPPRSITNLARQLNRGRAMLGTWSSRWRWQRRLEAYLADQEQRRLRELERDIRETNKRHLEAAVLLRNKAVDRLQSIDVNLLSPDSIVKFLALAVDIERKSLGIEKTGTGKTVTGSTVTQLSMSESREITNHLQEKLQKLSPFSRDLMRQITTKTLRILQLEAELASDEPPQLADIIDAEPDGASKEVGPAEEPGTEPGA